MEDKQQPLFKCETHDCNSEAVFRVHWPGQDKRFCLLCAVRAERVAFLMDFKLSMTPLYALLFAVMLGCSSSREMQARDAGAHVPAAQLAHERDTHRLAPKASETDALDAGQVHELQDAGPAHEHITGGSDAGPTPAPDASVDAGSDAGKPTQPPPCQPAFFCQ